MKEINITNLTLTDGSVIDWYRIVKESDGWHIDGHRINQFLVTFLLNNNTENILVDVKEKEPFDITKIPVPTKASTSTTAYRFLGYRIQGTTNVLSQEDLISYLNSLEQNIVLEAVYSETAIITQGGGTTAPTPITTTPVEVPSISEVVTTTQGTAITMPMQNNQQTESLTGENTTVIEDDEVARAESLSQGNAEEKDLTTIEDEGTALAAGIDSDCYIHWLILLIGIAYSVFAIVRIYLRKKEIDELEDDATSLETEA